MQVYLDNCATTAVDPQVLAAMQPYWQNAYANPSSPHRMGIEAENALTKCRAYLAQLLGVKPYEIYFTSGGTESNNLAIQGFARAQYKPGHMITTSIEHPSVLNPIRYLAEECGWDVSILSVDAHGKINMTELTDAIRDDTRLISIMLVNNETGVIQDLKQIGDWLATLNQHRDHPIILHVDACQALGKVQFDIKKHHIDLLSLSGHKIHGPKGIGMLYVNEKVRLKPIIYGGGQENGLRSGTENLTGVIGFTKACQLALTNLQSNTQKLQLLRTRMIEQLQQIPDSFCNSPADGAPNIINYRFDGIKAEVLVHYLEQREVYVSMGAACSSRKHETSHVLRAIGLTPEQAATSIRICLSPQLTSEQIDYAAAAIAQSVAEIRSIYR